MSFEVQAVVWVLVGCVKKRSSEMLLLFLQSIEAGFISGTGNFCTSMCHVFLILFAFFCQHRPIVAHDRFQWGAS